MSRATLHELGEVLFPSATVRLLPNGAHLLRPETLHWSPHSRRWRSAATGPEALSIPFQIIRGLQTVVLV